MAGDASDEHSRERSGSAANEHPDDPEYRQWRDEQARAMDRDYQSWRRERFSRSFAEWRAIRAAQAGLRTGSGPPITHADRERELRGPEWPERWDDGSGEDRGPGADARAGTPRNNGRTR